MPDNPTYLLGMEPAEVQRLGRQHEAWRDPTERVWRRAGFGPGQTIIDLGCGPGFCSLDLARLVGDSGRVIAVDSNATATNELSTAIRASGVQHIEVIRADVRSFDPSPWTPDGVFARWLFSFLENPEAVVQGLASRLRAGATVAVMDYWNYLALRTEPSAPLFRRVFRAVYDSYSAEGGGSLDVAGTLPALFRKCGLDVKTTEPVCLIARSRSPLWNWVGEFQRVYLPTLVDKGYLTAADLVEYESWWQQQDSNDDAFLFTPPVLCIIAVKR